MDTSTPVSAHERRNQECANRLAAQLAQREGSLLLVSLEPGLHSSRHLGITVSIGSLPGVARVAEAAHLPLELIESLFGALREGTRP